MFKILKKKKNEIKLSEINALDELNNLTYLTYLRNSNNEEKMEIISGKEIRNITISINDKEIAILPSMTLFNYYLTILHSTGRITYNLLTMDTKDMFHFHDNSNKITIDHETICIIINFKFKIEYNSIKLLLNKYINTKI